jgi:hypothetical protein
MNLIHRTCHAHHIMHLHFVTITFDGLLVPEYVIRQVLVSTVALTLVIRRRPY